jgi:hypothetical protein
MANTPEVRCEICGEWFDSRESLDEHSQKHRHSASRGTSSDDSERSLGRTDQRYGRSDFQEPED